ncbi:hypothetical protein POM88_028048 [Heracleum sosnowskyi]|uniref:Leucine-rich repeat-containing N-terminal plant-type domain-containing protein n=1 Tax=Heracleum sosnowskyi TaxID=360622 RepID=A0AAD8MQS0_9APIA|nr:hypothetical protein POM88_028048 [Heracleum sosnowskyi]
MASVSCIIIYTLLLVSSSSSSLESEREREALVRTGWWGNQIPFDAPNKQQHCSWSGIGCSEEGRVVSIICEYSIVDELGKLNFSSFPYLETLDLSYCGLNGSIPYQIGMLSKLNYLSFRGNYLTGELPFSFGNLTQLKTLDLSSNYLTIGNELEKLNFSSFPYLETLGLSYCT